MIMKIKGYSRCTFCNRLFKRGPTVIVRHRNHDPVFRNLQDRCVNCYLEEKQKFMKTPVELYLLRLDRRKFRLDERTEVCHQL